MRSGSGVRRLTARAEQRRAHPHHGPWLLLESDLVRDREVTSWPSVKTDLINAGARWQDAEVVVDGQLITSRKPDDIPAFAAAVAKALAA